MFGETKLVGICVWVWKGLIELKTLIYSKYMTNFYCAFIVFSVHERNAQSLGVGSVTIVNYVYIILIKVTLHNIVITLFFYYYKLNKIIHD